ncbi:MAG TPA: DoxX family protein [Stenomitos sp.]
MTGREGARSSVNAMFGRWVNLEPLMHAVLRIGAGLLFLEHALMKLFGWFGAPGPVPLVSMLGAAGVLELVGGLLLVIGLLVRPVGVLLALEMLVAYGMAHAPRGFWPLQNQGEPALLYMLIFAYLATAGAGPASVDAALRRRD